MLTILFAKISIFMVIRISSWAIFKILWSGNLQNLALYVFDIILISTTFVC